MTIENAKVIELLVEHISTISRSSLNLSDIFMVNNNSLESVIENVKINSGSIIRLNFDTTHNTFPIKTFQLTGMTMMHGIEYEQQQSNSN